MADDPYAPLAELYDLDHAGYADDIELYLRLAEVVGDPILELGSGTGRVLVPLVAAGHRVTGLDRSPAMLDRARAAITATEYVDRITLWEGEMTAADSAPGGPFGLAIFSLNGLLHLASQREQREALTAARRALDPRSIPSPISWPASTDGSPTRARGNSPMARGSTGSRRGHTPPRRSASTPSSGTMSLAQAIRCGGCARVSPCATSFRPNSSCCWS